MKRVRAAVFPRTVLAAGLLVLVSVAALSRPAGRAAVRTQPSGTSDTEAVKTRLTELFGLCQADDIDAAAGYFVYRGPDKSREWKDTYRAADADERAAVRDGCARIKRYLDESQDYSLGPVKVEREPEGEWHVVEVSFRQGAGTKRVFFAFLPIKGQFSIGDID